MKNRSSNGMTFSTSCGWVICIVIMCFPVAPVAAASAAPVVVLANLQPPFMDIIDNKPEGLAVDIVVELFQRANVAMEIRFMPPKRAYVTALTSPNHCALAVERSQEREALFNWVSPILISRHGLYALPGQGPQLRTLEDARGMTIGSYLGSGVGEYLEAMGFSVEYAGRNELNAHKLEKRRIDLWTSDTLSAELISRKFGMRIEQPALMFLTTLQSMACNLDMPRAQIKLLESTLTNMYRDGAIKRLYARYGSQDP